jgi:hypothetical protein
MADDYRAGFRQALAREPVRHFARLAQFQARWFSFHRLATERALRAACTAGRSAVTTTGLLRPPPHHYQGYTGPWIEDYFLAHWLKHAPDTDVAYLPVFWTDLFLHAQTHRFTPGQRDRFTAELRDLLDRTLAGPRCYFTLLEYDHMIWDWHAFPRNVAVFSAGGWGDVPLPLLKGSPAWSCPAKDIRLSFVGRLDGASDAGSVRSRMHAALRGHALFTAGPQWREIMGRSTFSLCPRGLGRASFRLYEALSVGSIPIYLWDDREWLPYRDEIDWAEISISLNIADVARLPGILASYDAAHITAMQQRIRALYDDHFTLDGTCRQVLRRVVQLADRSAFRRLAEARPYPDGTVPVVIPDFLRRA